MFWNLFSKKQVVPEPEVPVNKEFPKPELSYVDYPKIKYKSYWEMFFKPVNDGWEAEIRFIGYADSPHTSIHTVVSDSREQVEKLAIKLVKEKMENYKR